jgi:hypothetical protein
VVQVKQLERSSYLILRSNNNSGSSIKACDFWRGFSCACVVWNDMMMMYGMTVAITADDYCSCCYLLQYFCVLQGKGHR